MFPAPYLTKRLKWLDKALILMFNHMTGFSSGLPSSIGDQDAITFEVLLGDEFYEVATPGSVYIPRDLPHAIRLVKATVGLSGGLIPVYLNGEYVTLPA